MQRTGDLLYDIYDKFTGEDIKYIKTTTWLDGSTMTDAKCDGIVYKKLGSEYFKRAYTILTPEHFGAIGDGTTDNRIAFQKIATSGIPTITLKGGNYYISGSVTFTRGIIFEGTGTISCASTDNGFIFRPTTTTSLDVTVGANINFPTVSTANVVTPITVASTAGFVKGDIILVTSEDGYTFDDGPKKRGELIQILEIINSTTLYTAGILSDTYTTSPKITKLSKEYFEVGEGITFTQSTDPYTSTSNYIGVIRAIGCCDVSIKGTYKRLTSAAINLTTCWKPKVDITVSNLRDKVSGANYYGYGVQTYGATRFGRIKVHATSVRHTYTGAGEYNPTDLMFYGAVRDMTIEDCIAINTTAASFDTHPGEFNANFRNCVAYFNIQDSDASVSQVFAFQDRGINTLFENCHSYNSGYGFYLGTGISGSGYTSRGRINDCSINIHPSYTLTNAQQLTLKVNSAGGNVNYVIENTLFTKGILAFDNASPSISFDGCRFDEVATIRLGEYNKIDFVNCKRINTTGTTEAIQVGLNTTLTLSNYFAKANAFGSSCVVNTIGSTVGTCTINQGDIDTVPFLSTPIKNNGTVISNIVVTGIRELLTNKSTDSALGSSDILYPSQNAVKTAIGNSITNAVASDTETQITTSITEDNKFVSRLKLYNWWIWVKTQAQTISGAWTFSSAITASTTPTNNAHLTNKTYVDGKNSLFQKKVAAPKVANYTITNGDFTIPVDASSGAIIISLPTSVSAFNSTLGGYTFNIKKIDSSENTVTIKANGTEIIDGSNTQVIDTQYQSITVQSNGTSWYII